jgi:peptide chain release factor 2
MLKEFAEEGLLEEVENDLKAAYKQMKQFKQSFMFNDKYDKNNVILSVHAGAGGKEAQDWATMLVRMYCRWSASKGFKVEMLDSVAGDDNRYYKSATIEIKGKNAYGMLKNEAGVHRLVRVSPFDANGRRHTSFSAVEVMPEVELDKEVSIRNEDLRIDYFRASGAGGQHVNTTDSAVRITHLPTGIVVSCQQERSQHQNKDYAMKILASKLMAIKEKEHYAEISDIKGEQRQIEWGSQIRSYIFMPYQLVKDHRTGCETGNIEAVMNGDINEFIYKSLAE